MSWYARQWDLIELCVRNDGVAGGIRNDFIQARAQNNGRFCAPIAQALHRGVFLRHIRRLDPPQADRALPFRRPRPVARMPVFLLPPLRRANFHRGSQRILFPASDTRSGYGAWS